MDRTMKKTYNKPEAAVFMVDGSAFVCASGDVTTTLGEDEIPFGGIDGEGTIIPSARSLMNVWGVDEAD